MCLIGQHVFFLGGGGFEGKYLFINRFNLNLSIIAGVFIWHIFKNDFGNSNWDPRKEKSLRRWEHLWWQWRSHRGHTGRVSKFGGRPGWLETIPWKLPDYACLSLSMVTWGCLSPNTEEKIVFSLKKRVRLFFFPNCWGKKTGDPFINKTELPWF